MSKQYLDNRWFVEKLVTGTRICHVVQVPSPGYLLIETHPIKPDLKFKSTVTLRKLNDFANLTVYDTFDAAVASLNELEHADTKAIREYREDDKIVAQGLLNESLRPNRGAK
jgi:hypothetical protein